MGGFGSRYSAFDRFQQRHRWLGFPLAVLQKYADDQGGYHAATITYYGFFAIFPLLLVLTTVLGFILQSHPHLEQRIVDSALGQFPVIGPQLNHGTSGATASARAAAGHASSSANSASTRTGASVRSYKDRRFLAGARRPAELAPTLAGDETVSSNDRRRKEEDRWSGSTRTRPGR